MKRRRRRRPLNAGQEQLQPREGQQVRRGGEQEQWGETEPRIQYPSRHHADRHAAIVGDPDQVLAKINAYRAAGMESFILSGYPHAAECDLFARCVLPRLEHAALGR